MAFIRKISNINILFAIGVIVFIVGILLIINYTQIPTLIVLSSFGEASGSWVSKEILALVCGICCITVGLIIIRKALKKKELQKTDDPVKKKKFPIVRILIFTVLFISIYQTVYVELVNDAIRDDDLPRVKALTMLPGNTNYHFFYGDGFSENVIEFACMKAEDEKGLELVEYLLRHGANANSPNLFRQPLDYAYGSDYRILFELVELLVENGADVTLTGDQGPNIFWLMNRQDYWDRETLEEANAEVYKTLKYVTEHGANVKPVFSALSYYGSLILNKNFGVFEYLFNECGIDINEQDGYDGETVLIQASGRGILEMVDFLLGLGADPYLQDKEGKMAIDYARQGGFKGIVALLFDERESSSSFYIVKPDINMSFDFTEFPDKEIPRSKWTINELAKKYGVIKEIRAAKSPYGSGATWIDVEFEDCSVGLSLAEFSLFSFSGEAFIRGSYSFSEEDKNLEMPIRYVTVRGASTKLSHDFQIGKTMKEQILEAYPESTAFVYVDEKYDRDLISFNYSFQEEDRSFPELYYNKTGSVDYCFDANGLLDHVDVIYLSSD